MRFTTLYCYRWATHRPRGSSHSSHNSNNNNHSHNPISPLHPHPTNTSTRMDGVITSPSRKWPLTSPLKMLKRNPSSSPRKGRWRLRCWPKHPRQWPARQGGVAEEGAREVGICGDGSGWGFIPQDPKSHRATHTRGQNVASAIFGRRPERTSSLFF